MLCRNLFHKNSIHNDRYLIDLSTEDTYQVVDSLNTNLMVEAHVRDRTLFFSMYTKTNEKERSPLLRGGEQFERLVSHLAGKFDVIRGFWTNMRGYSFSDNLDLFNAALREGVLEKEAPFYTWTGRQAKKYGYNKATVVFHKGEFGNYSDVVVDFFK